MYRNKKFSGWQVLIGCLVLMIFPGGLLSFTSGLFMYPICEELGFSITTYGFTATIGSVVNAFTSAFIVQYLSKGRKETMKLIMFIAVIISCAGFMTLGLCTKIWQFYLITAIYSFGYNMLTFVPVGMMINNWFIKKQALITGIAFSGVNFGGAVFSTVITQSISNYGWRFSYYFGGGLCLVAGLIAILFIKRSPHEYGESPYGAEEKDEINGEKSIQSTWDGMDKKTAMKMPIMYLLCLAMFFTGLYATGVSVHVVTYLCSEGGWDIVEAGIVMTIFTLAGVLGSTGGGMIINKTGLKKGIYIGAAFLIVAIVSLIMSKTYKPFAYIWAIGQGVAIYLAALVPSLSVSVTFGMKDYAGIYGVVYAFYLVGCAVATPFIAFIAEIANYKIAWIGVIVMVLLVVTIHVKCIDGSNKPESVSLTSN